MAEIAAHAGSSRSGRATVADRLRDARRRRFVGRAAELELFRGALAAPELPFSVLWVYGPGGLGKTTLLTAFAEAAVIEGLEPVSLDLRGIEPSPPGFLAELARAVGEADGGAALDALATRDRAVLLLDTFEAAVALEDWVRDELVPTLPASALTVIAGRGRPADGWRRDPGWHDLLRVVSLRNLAPEDGRELLRRAGVPGEVHARLLDLTHGHPLALSLFVEVLAQRDADSPPLELEAVPDVVGALVASFAAGVPTARHRRALEIAAHARVTTAGLLNAALGEEDLYGWLRALTFVEAGPHGLFLHDLAREVIDADLRWRDRTAYEEVHALVRRDVVHRLTTCEGREQQRALADLMFLHRGNPAAPAFWEWDSLGEVYADAIVSRDHTAIVEMVNRHEGPGSAAIATHWLERQPQGFAVFRGRGVEPLGFLAELSLHEASEDHLAADQGTQAAWQHAHRHTPPRPGDEVVVGRLFMDRDAYQAPSRSLNVVTMRCVQTWLGRPRLCWYYLVFADADAFAPLMAYIGFERAPDADFEVDGHRYGVYARDWRREDGVTWLERMNERELGGEPPAPTGASVPPLALSQADFALAVRRALRDLHRPAALATNPLMRSRLLAETRGAQAAELRALLDEAVAALSDHPRDAKLARAVERTYLKPAPTQEAAAELLGLPFSTYRGHLARGIDRVTDWLWHRELYGPEGR